MATMDEKKYLEQIEMETIMLEGIMRMERIKN